MDDIFSLPAKYFHDDELEGARVRLATDQNLGQGHFLHRGEVFTVIGCATKIESSTGFIRRERIAFLSNHRAKMIPMRVAVCELMFEWPASVEGKRDGQSS